MSETKTPGEKKLSVSKLTLKPRTETGTVRQSFSHGRSKQVVVEVKKRRTTGAEAKTEVAPSVETKKPTAPRAKTGTVTAAAVVHQPIERLHPFSEPFAFVLVKLDGADTSLAHIVVDGFDRVRVGSRVTAVWRADDDRVGSMRDIERFALAD